MPTILDENTEQLNKTRQSLVPVIAPWFRAYIECSDEVQSVIRDMVDIISSDDADDDDKEMATATMLEALFPSTHNGALGADLEELEQEWKGQCPKSAKVVREMDREEAIFADRVNSLMASKGMSQSELAKIIGVGQPAISMMLARKSRPQKRTIGKIAEALGVSVAELWTEAQRE